MKRVALAWLLVVACGGEVVDLPQYNDRCDVSYDCIAGYICNVPAERLYDSLKPEKTCIKVVCQADTECNAPFVCSMRKLCASPSCEHDSECGAGMLCLAGACTTAPDAAMATRCVMTTPNQLAGAGAVHPRALAFDARGAALPGVLFDFAAAPAGGASVDAEGGFHLSEGTVRFTATVRANPAVSCEGPLVTRPPAVAGDALRVLVYGEDTGLPIRSATVTLDLGGVVEARVTDEEGAITVSSTAAVRAVTAEHARYEVITLIAPASRALVLRLARAPEASERTGFSGSARLPLGPQEDIRIAYAGASLGGSVLDHQLAPQPAEIIPTAIDAPELGLNEVVAPLSGSLVLQLGYKQFTDANAGSGPERRCFGASPADSDQLGCYVVRARPGAIAPYFIGANLKLSMVTPYASMIAERIMRGEENIFPYGLGVTLPGHLLEDAQHAVRPYEVLPELDGDYQRYPKIDLDAAVLFSNHALIALPQLPQLEGGCGASVYVGGYALTTGRGAVPLGARVARDVGDPQRPELADCVLDPSEAPFGEYTRDTESGTAPLSTAPLHSGLEGETRFVAATAFLENAADPDASRSMIVRPVPSIRGAVDLSTTAFLPVPAAEISLMLGTVTLTEARIATEATGVRLTVVRGARRWTIYAPAELVTFEVPNIPGAAELWAADAQMKLQALRTRGELGDLFTVETGSWAEIVLENVDAFSSEKCSAGQRCTVIP